MFKRDSGLAALLITIAALVMTSVQAARGAVVTVSYVNGVVSTTSTFTAGTTTAVNLANVVLFNPGQFFRFGVAVSVSNNPNPEFGTAYAAAASATYGATYPANLGFADLGIVVGSSNPSGTAVVPLNNGSNKTRVAFNSGLWTGAVTDTGDISAATPGIAGSPSSIFKGLSPVFDPASPSSVTGLATLATPGANFINTLPYAMLASALGNELPVDLTPTIKLSDTAIWTRTIAGVADGAGGITSDAAFGARALGPGDSVVYPSAFNGAIRIGIPEPASSSLLGLAAFCLLVRRVRATQ